MDEFDPRSYDNKPPGSVMARPNFIELPTPLTSPRAEFFSENVFGLKMTSFGPTYACTLTGDVDIGLQADRAEASKAPLPVIDVKDLEATLAAVTAAGAAITKPIFSFPGGRGCFQFLDPSGNELAAMRSIGSIFATDLDRLASRIAALQQRTEVEEPVDSNCRCSSCSGRHPGTAPTA